MKAQINLRSTFRNTTTLQRRSAALTALVLTALIGTLLIYIARPSAQSIPTGRVSLPAHRGNNVPVIGTGSAYDGGHYVDTLPIRHSLPNLSKIGTGSVYDGGHYVDTPVSTLRVSPNLSKIGTNSVYDGGN